MKFWENRTASLFSYFVMFLDIQGIFYFGEVLDYIYQFYFFRAFLMYMVSKNQGRFFCFPEKPLGRIVQGLCFLLDNQVYICPTLGVYPQT